MSNQERNRIIEIPENMLQGCHNCKWYEKEAYRCNDGDPYECNWENDGTYVGAS